MNESIEQQVYRLVMTVFGEENASEPLEIVSQEPEFKLLCELVQQAKNEEREVCAAQADEWAMQYVVEDNAPRRAGAFIRSRA
jgi:hypothetical protein